MSNWLPPADDENTFCVRCGRSIGWHAGRKCFGPRASGMPSPVPAVREELPDPGGEPLSIYPVPSGWVAFYEGGWTRHYGGVDGAPAKWGERKCLWPERRHWMGMLEQKKRKGSRRWLTPAGKRMLGLPVAGEQARLF